MQTRMLLALAEALAVRLNSHDLDQLTKTINETRDSLGKADRTLFVLTTFLSQFRYGEGINNPMDPARFRVLVAELEMGLRGKTTTPETADELPL